MIVFFCFLEYSSESSSLWFDPVLADLACCFLEPDCLVFLSWCFILPLSLQIYLSDYRRSQNSNSMQISMYKHLILRLVGGRRIHKLDYLAFWNFLVVTEQGIILMVFHQFLKATNKLSRLDSLRLLHVPVEVSLVNIHITMTTTYIAIFKPQSISFKLLHLLYWGRVWLFVKPVPLLTSLFCKL